MSRVGLVLGAGGVAGQAYHAGVLHALQEAVGWDARDAEVIVGTSAGALVGGLLRGGVAPRDVAARYTGDPLSPEGAAPLRRLGPPPPTPMPAGPELRFGSPRLLARTVARPWSVLRPGLLATALLPAGQVSIEPLATGLRALHPDGWPRRALWLTAVRLDDGRLVVFGRKGAPDTDVGTAVMASCAIPGWFRPVEVAGRRYVDGGAHSVTNADLLRDEALDLAVVVAPMSVARGAEAVPRSPLGAALLATRAAVRLRLAQEVRALRRAGTPVVVFQPTVDDLEAMGPNAMAERARAPVTRQARRSALRRLERPGFRARLAALAPAAG